MTFRHLSNAVFFRLAVSVLLAIPAIISAPAPTASQSPGASAGIFQLTAGDECRGVIICLRKTRLKKEIAAAQIKITEAKHGHDLREIMDWRVNRGGKQIVIRFKPGKGGFGGGNSVEIEIDRSAFARLPGPGALRFRWVIETDVM
jgi:hypothetical protein